MEVACYVVLCAVPVRMLRLVALELVAVAMVVNILTAGASLFVHLPIAFFVGSLIHDRRRLSSAISVLLLAGTVVAALIGVLAVVAPLTLPYTMIWLGLRLPVRLTRDVSFGVYIYGWPVQQLLAMAGMAALGLAPYLGLTVAVTFAIAYLSARLVEEPALRLRTTARFRWAATKSQNALDPDVSV
jgi:hypothetical protein